MVADYFAEPLDVVRNMAQHDVMQYSDEQLATVGANIRRLREPHWKQIEFAALVDISRSHLSRIERGQHRADPTVYQRIADALGITPYELSLRPRSKRGAA